MEMMAIRSMVMMTRMTMMMMQVIMLLMFVTIILIWISDYGIEDDNLADNVPLRTK